MVTPRLPSSVSARTPRRVLYGHTKRVLLRLLAGRWKGPRYTLELAVRRFLRAKPRSYLSRLAADRGLALAAVAAIATTGIARAVPPVELSDIAAGDGGFVMNGIDPYDTSGVRVSGAGDVNGDGLADVIVGADYADPGGNLDAGESYVIFGKAGGLAVSLADVVAGSGGFVINGIDVNDISGFSVSGAGDVNGDGLADVIVGAPFADPGGNSDAGESYVVFGRAGTAPVNLSAVAAGTGGFVINGINANDESGFSVSGTGDVNGDGLSDVIVGAPGGNNYAGRSYVIFGKAGTAPVDLSAVAAGSGGFVINGIDQDDQSGYSVAGAGDVNGDGLADVIVGARNADPGGNSSAGESYVVFGKADTAAVNLSEIASGIGGFVLNGIDAYDHSGISVSGAGDVNGDTLDDVIVGAVDAEPGGNPSAGESYVVFGKIDGTAVNLSDVATGAGGFVINGIDSADRSGFAVSGAGDVNGDGLADVIVGAKDADPAGISYAGESYVVFGKTDGTAVNLSDVVAGSGGFVINGPGNYDRSGCSVSSAGMDWCDKVSHAWCVDDVNGDGLADVIVGAYYHNAGGNYNAGASYLVFSPFTISFDPPDETPAAGPANREAVGDLDGDGDTDVVIAIRGDGVSPGSVQVFLNMGNDANNDWLGLDPILPPTDVGLTPSGVAVGFLDNDADLDVAATNAGNNTVTILLNTGNGDGTFVSSVVPVGNQPSAVVTGDFDLDAFTDLAVANAGDDNVQFLFNDGTGSFPVSETALTGGVGPIGLITAIIDEDKCPDVVGANANGTGGPPGNVFVLLNQGDGTFGPAVTFDIGVDPTDLTAGDIDRDGLIDIVAVNGADATASVLINLGGGMFAPAVNIVVGAEPLSIEAVDLDQDLKADLALVATDSVIGRAVQVLRNIGVNVGEVSFDPPLAFNVGAEPNFVVSADFNADEEFDLVTVNELLEAGAQKGAGGSVTVLLNSPPPLLTCTGDTDGDGEVGIVDFLILLAQWGPCTPNCFSDLDGDGVVGIQDFLELLSRWGPCE